MKNFVFILFLYLTPFTLWSQKVKVQVVKVDITGKSEWQILDENYKIVFSGNESFRNDSVTFSLDDNKRYFIQVSVLEIYHRDTSLYTLILNGEPIILIKSDIEPGDHFFPFFTGTRNSDVKITGGTTAIISDFPWQVYLIAGNFQCGGSIIDSNWILTAAHCTENNSGSLIPAANMHIKVGANNPSNATEGKTYFISKVIVHEAYNGSTHQNDIALLKLTEPLNYPNAVPIKLVTSDDVASGATDPGVMSWVTGWGLTHVNPNVIPTSLQKVQLPVITNAQASTVWGPIPSTDIMAGFLNGNKDACSGDSGGPMVVQVIDEYKLAGIVSWGSSNCNTYGAYSRVSLFEDWIRTNTGIVKEFRPPTPTGDSLVCQGSVTSQYSITSLPAGTAYEWRILPSNAGIVSGNSSNAIVSWNQGFVGSAQLILRVTINNKVSEWSRLDLKVVLSTKLVSQSPDTTICAGQPIILKVGATGYNLNYKWEKNGTIVQSGLSPQLNISITTIDNSGAYVCEISGYCNTVSSGIMNLTVLPVTKIDFISPDVQVQFGGNVTLDVNAEGHNLIYQWQKDKIALDNSTTSVLSLYDLNASDIGLYRTIVTGTCGTVTSGSIYVYVKKGNYSGEPEVFLWPSITSAEFNIALSSGSNYNVNIYNTRGQLIRELTNCRYQISINVSTFAKGTYIINVFNNNFRKSLRIIKE